MVDFKAMLNAVYVSASTYSTLRVARIRSWKIAVLFRFFQLVVIGYIVGWSILYKKGYQSFDSVSSAITTKVKGLGYIYDDTNGNSSNSTIPRVFDTADYVIPPSEYNSVKLNYKSKAKKLFQNFEYLYLRFL
jgi:P2X purinoceptor 4